MMNLMEVAAGLLSDKLGIDSSTAMSGLQRLFGGDGEGLDIAGLVATLQQSGLGDIVGSWLGDGANQSVDPSTLQNAFGADEIDAAAQTMGVDSGSLLGGLSDVIPRLVDKASSGGSLLESVGGLGGVADITKKLF